jgi:uncharacterized membrane protein YhaH (DUF805 family)
MQWYLKVLKNYVGFEGRARRSEYWWFVLIHVLILLVLYVISRSIGNTLLYTLYSLAVFLPGLAVAVRRLHDTDKSGWWVLIALIPIVGAIVLLVFMATDSTPGTNQYGPSPKEATAGAY